MNDLKLYASKKSLESLIQTVRVFSNYLRMEFAVFANKQFANMQYSQ